MPPPNHMAPPAVSVAPVLLAGLLGCVPAGHERPPPVPSPPPVEYVAPAASAPEPPEAMSSTPAGNRRVLHSEEAIVTLELEQRRVALASLPLGATEPRPLLIATHGAGGTALKHCQAWRRIAGDRGFVLCPQGAAIYPHGPPGEQRYFYPGHPSLGQELSDALDALRKRYGAFLDTRAPLYAGFSQGASMGSMVLPDHPIKFARVALVEGGFGEHQEWNIATSRRFVANGGRRVLLVCGRAKCTQLANETASYMKKGGLLARVVTAHGAGHVFLGAVEQKLADTFAWLVEGDSRWSR